MTVIISYACSKLVQLWTC